MIHCNFLVPEEPNARKIGSKIELMLSEMEFLGVKLSFWIQTVLLKPELPADRDLTSKRHLSKIQNFVKTTPNDNSNVYLLQKQNVVKLA